MQVPLIRKDNKEGKYPIFKIGILRIFIGNPSY